MTPSVFSRGGEAAFPGRPDRYNVKALLSSAARDQIRQAPQTPPTNQPLVTTPHPLRGISTANHDAPLDATNVALPDTGFKRERPFGAGFDVGWNTLINDYVGRIRVVVLPELAIISLPGKLHSETAADRYIIGPVRGDGIQVMA